jgi:hypothetical protein
MPCTHKNTEKSAKRLGSFSDIFLLFWCGRKAFRKSEDKFIQPTALML